MEYEEYKKLIERYSKQFALRALEWWQKQPLSVRNEIDKNRQAEYCISNQHLWILVSRIHRRAIGGMNEL